MTRAGTGGSGLEDLRLRQQGSLPRGCERTEEIRTREECQGSVGRSGCKGAKKEGCVSVELTAGGKLTD